MNPCQTGSHNCARSAQCVPRGGHSFDCKCNVGYGGRNCGDIDECIKPNSCGANEICRNTVGSFKCDCRDGFKRQSNQCVDVDECRENLHGCPDNTKCLNQLGSYKCESIIKGDWQNEQLSQEQPMQYTYTIEVKTTDKYLAGTNDRIQVKIIGSDTGETKWLGLNDGKDNFERNDLDKFKINLNDLGETPKFMFSVAGLRIQVTFKKLWFVNCLVGIATGGDVIGLKSRGMIKRLSSASMV